MNLSKARWNFEYSDGSGAVTLPRVALTFLDMGANEFVAVEKGAVDVYFAGSRLSVENDWGVGGWATRFIASTPGSTLTDVEDPMAMDETQQQGAMQIILSQRSSVDSASPHSAHTSVAS